MIDHHYLHHAHAGRHSIWTDATEVHLDPNQCSWGRCTRRADRIVVIARPGRQLEIRQACPDDEQVMRDSYPDGHVQTISWR